jgi:hypothetical protein
VSWPTPVGNDAANLCASVSGFESRLQHVLQSKFEVPTWNSTILFNAEKFKVHNSYNNNNNSMKQSPSWEAVQEIPRILWKTEVRYRSNDSPPQDSILGNRKVGIMGSTSFL